MHWQESQHPSIGKEPGQVARRAPSRDTYPRGVTLIASGSMTEAPPAREREREELLIRAIDREYARTGRECPQERRREPQPPRRRPIPLARAFDDTPQEGARLRLHAPEFDLSR